MRWKTKPWDRWRYTFALLPVRTGTETIWLERYGWRWEDEDGRQIRYALLRRGRQTPDGHDGPGDST